MTRAQSKVLDALKAWQRTHDYPPSLQELTTALGLVSSSTVHVHVKALLAAGLIRQSGTAKRNLYVVEKAKKAKLTLDRLEPFLAHKATCEVHDRFWAGGDEETCDCGLRDIVAELT